MWRCTPILGVAVVSVPVWLLMSTSARRSAHATAVYSASGVTSTVAGFVLGPTSMSYVRRSVANQSMCPVAQNCFLACAAAVDGHAGIHSPSTHHPHGLLIHGPRLHARVQLTQTA